MLEKFAKENLIIFFIHSDRLYFSESKYMLYMYIFIFYLEMHFNEILIITSALLNISHFVNTI